MCVGRGGREGAFVEVEGGVRWRLEVADGVGNGGFLVGRRVGVVGKEGGGMFGV